MTMRGQDPQDNGELLFGCSFFVLFSTKTLNKKKNSYINLFIMMLTHNYRTKWLDTF